MILVVEIHTDGMGTFQARCLSCEWRGAWRRQEAKSVIEGKTHRCEGTN